jgi:glycerol-3-phosphate dehydrogenase (NAD(P)+)
MTKRPVKVAVLGAGSWGTTVAALAAGNAPTTIWSRASAVAEDINQRHRNSRYLPDLDVPESLVATSDLEKAVWDADVLVVGVPSHGFRDVLVEAAPFVRPWIPVVSLTKGLEQETDLRMTQVIEEILPGHPAGVLAGPNLAREVLAGYAAATVIAMPDEHVARSLQGIFARPAFRVYRSDDVLGCEIGGALKNVIAIAAGIGIGLGVGDNTRAMVISRGLAELSRLGTAMGGDPQTFSGLTGLGDLMATCISPLSRNRRVGEMLAAGRTVEQITDEMSMVAEGIKTCRVVMNLSERLAVPMPICAEVNAVVHHGRTAQEAYRGLGRVAPGSEQGPV